VKSLANGLATWPPFSDVENLNGLSRQPNDKPIARCRVGLSRPQRPSANEPSPLARTPIRQEMQACAETEFPNQLVVEGSWKPSTLDDENEKHDEFTRDWYSKALCAMSDPPLTAPLKNRACPRFLWLRSVRSSIAGADRDATAKTRVIRRTYAHS
jgi:hypothetical protein